jgi:hypothetical protein
MQRTVRVPCTVVSVPLMELIVEAREVLRPVIILPGPVRLCDRPELAVGLGMAAVEPTKK